eukprot:4518071-Prymnesium_polylepis.1
MSSTAPRVRLGDASSACSDLPSGSAFRSDGLVLDVVSVSRRLSSAVSVDGEASALDGSNGATVDDDIPSKRYWLCWWPSNGDGGAAGGRE